MFAKDVTAINGIGIDAVEVDRIAAALQRRPALLTRLFTQQEQQSAAGDPQRLAARFAAKEAAMKALGTGIGGLGWKDVEVVREDSGAPRLNVTARAKELATSQGVTKWHVSLTHIANMAMAVVVTER
jgi:holo-[acyl-carrier protein] synthase